jgi:accessory gene regulator B
LDGRILKLIFCKGAEVMDILDRFSFRLAVFATGSQPAWNEEKQEIVRYGVYIIVSDAVKLIIMLLAAYFLGIFKYTLISLICFGFFRSFAGGVHSKTWLGCLITNTVIFFSLVYISLYIQGINPAIVTLTVFFAGLIIVYKYVPGDIENKPIPSRRQRNRLKVLSFLVLSLLGIISLMLSSQPLSNIIMLSVVVELAAVLPVTYKITGTGYGSSFKTK